MVRLAAYVILLFSFRCLFLFPRIRRLIGFQPAGIFDNRWDFARFSAFKSLVPVFFRRYLHHLIKVPVEVAQGAEAGHLWDGEDSVVGIAEQVAGVHDTYRIQIS